MVKADLHVHTSESDGKYGMEEVVQRAIRSGVRVLALTDHNQAPEETFFQWLYQKYKDQIELIRGAEISANYVASNGRNVELHIVALNFDSAKMEWLKKRRMDREGYVNAIRDKLALCGVQIPTYDELQKLYPETKHLGRKHIAEWMYQNGIVPSVDAAFDIYIGAFGERRAFVESSEFRNYESMEEVIRLILDAGGIPVLAHLFYYRLDDEEIHRLLQRFKACAGELAAMEVLYSRYVEDKNLTERLFELANQYDILYSCGSDFHGQDENEKLGYAFPACFWNRMELRQTEMMLIQKLFKEGDEK